MSAAPVVYFIDDSATMREVIKIAFRRENIEVVACHDGESALAQMEQQPPDVVISDVIMPGKDGYEVCQMIKQHPVFGRAPVILMSGVVNRGVADRAVQVKADELIRKPFQPQDLITRVRHLLQPKPAQPNVDVAASAAALSSIFGAPAAQPARAQTAPAPMQPPAPQSVYAAQPVAQQPSYAQPVYAQQPPQQAYQQPRAQQQPPVQQAQQSYAQQPVYAPPAPATHVAPPMPQRPQPSAPPAGNTSLDLAKMRVEVLRLQSQIKKLESELAAERQYSSALEEHIKTLQDAE